MKAIFALVVDRRAADEGRFAGQWPGDHGIAEVAGQHGQATDHHAGQAAGTAADKQCLPSLQVAAAKHHLTRVVDRRREELDLADTGLADPGDGGDAGG